MTQEWLTQKIPCPKCSGDDHRKLTCSNCHGAGKVLRWPQFWRECRESAERHHDQTPCGYCNNTLYILLPLTLDTVIAVAHSTGRPVVLFDEIESDVWECDIWLRPVERVAGQGLTPVSAVMDALRQVAEVGEHVAKS